MASTQDVIIEAMADQITRLKERVHTLQGSLKECESHRGDLRRALANICANDASLKAMYGYLLNEHSTP